MTGQETETRFKDDDIGADIRAAITKLEDKEPDDDAGERGVEREGDRRKRKEAPQLRIGEEGGERGEPDGGNEESEARFRA